MSFLTKMGDILHIKALSEMRFPGRSFVFFDFPRLDIDEIAREVGDGTSSDLVITPIRWLQRAFKEAPVVVLIDDEIVENDPLPELLAKPNEFYSSDTLFAGTVYSLSTGGNAYWLKVRNLNGVVKELWWIPDTIIEPKWPDEGNVFISHYQYNVGGRKIDLEPSEVIHFRDGVDPQNMRKGLSPLRGLLREIWTDNEAAVFTAALMRNGGVPGVVISPDGPDAVITPAQAEQVKEKFTNEFTRERRGKPIVMSGPTKVEQFGFNPRQMDLSPLRNISEERVTAALGVPAAVVGFGAGLETSKVGATMRELRQLAWHNGVIPLQQIVASTLQRSLLPDLSKGQVVQFDNSDVAALADDENKHVERVTKLVTAGVWTRGEGRVETGKEAGPNDEVYLLPLNVLEVPVSGTRATPEKQLKHNHTLLEERIVETAPQATPAQAVQGFGKIIDRLRLTLPVSMEFELLKFFADLGASAEVQALEVLVQKDSLDAARIAEGMELLGWERSLRQLFERHYLRVGGEIGVALAKFLSVEVGLPDAAARALLATGGTRAGLLDLTAKTRRKIFQRLVEGRINGLAGDNLARFIRDGVEAGPWSTSAIRAKVIARTETAFATNIATVEAARGITGVEQMMILDARAGPTDELCEQMNGRVVTIDEARQLVADEHPMGTRSVVPMTPQLLQEMGL